MNKKLLMSLALASAGSFIAPQVWAQSEPTNGGVYYLKNVSSGQFLNASNNWGSRASLMTYGTPVTLTLSDGKYTIDTGISNGGDSHFLGSNGFMDAGSAAFTIEKTTDGSYTLTADGTNYFGSDGTSVVALNLASTAEDAKWQFYTLNDLKASMNNASPENPVNVAFYIKNPRAYRKCDKYTWKSPWTINENNMTVWSGEGGSDGGWGAIETWNSTTFNVSQTLTGLKNGVYELSCSGFYRAGGNAESLTAFENGTVSNGVLFANEKEQPLLNQASYKQTSAVSGLVTEVNGYFVPNSLTDAAHALFDGYYADNKVKAVVTDGTLKIGVKKNAKIDNDWMAFNYFDLYYLGVDLTALKEALGNLITEAQKLEQEGMAPATKTALNGAITAAQNVAENEDALGTATTNLRNAMDAATECVAPYADLTALIAKCNAEKTNSTAEESDKNTLDAAIAAAETASTEAVTVEALNNAATTLEAARQAYVVKAVPTTGNTLDYSFLLGDASTEISRWTRTWTGGNYTYKHNAREKNTDEFVTDDGFLESWQGSAYSGTMTCVASNLPQGHYRISAYAFSNVEGTTSFFAGDQSVALDKSTDLFTNPSLDVVVGLNGELSFGLKLENSKWVGITNVQLQYVSALTNEEMAAMLKPELQSLIETATAANASVGGKEVFFKDNTELEKALSTANTAVEGNDSETLKAAFDALKDANDAFKTAALIAPEESQAYKLVLSNNGGWTSDDKAVTTMAGNRADMGGYNVQYLATSDNNNYATAFFFVPAEGGYKLMFVDADGSNRYICTAKTAYNSGDVYQLRTTTDADKALVVEVQREGVNLKLYNTEAKRYIGSQNEGFYTVDSHTNFKFEETTAANNIEYKMAAEYGTLMLPYAVAEIPDGLTVYSCATTTDAKLNLNEVTSIEANVPYLVKGTAGETYSFSGVNTAYKPSYNAGVFTGVFVATTVPTGSYVLQNNDGKLAFYKVDSEITLNANHCYLTATAAPAGVKAFFFDGDATGIESVEAADATVNVYSVNGTLVRANVKASEALNGLAAGVYVVNGEKKMVK